MKIQKGKLVSMPSGFAARVKEYRRRTGKTQGQIASEAGVKSSFVAWVEGERSKRVGAINYHRLASVLAAGEVAARPAPAPKSVPAAVPAELPKPTPKPAGQIPLFPEDSADAWLELYYQIPKDARIHLYRFFRSTIQATKEGRPTAEVVL